MKLQGISDGGSKIQGDVDVGFQPFLRIFLFWGINLEMTGFLGSSPGGMKTVRFSVAETPKNSLLFLCWVTPTQEHVQQHFYHFNCCQALH